MRREIKLIIIAIIIAGVAIFAVHNYESKNQAGVEGSSSVPQAVVTDGPSQAQSGLELEEHDKAQKAPQNSVVTETLTPENGDPVRNDHPEPKVMVKPFNLRIHPLVRMSRERMSTFKHYVYSKRLDIDECYYAQFKDGQIKPGFVSVMISFSEDGTITFVEKLKKEYPTPVFECLKERIMKWKIPNTEEGTTVELECFY